MKKTTQNPMCHTSGLKISESLSLNSTHQGLSNKTPNFPIKLSFDLNEFLVKIMFNIQ
jgi:hypothetical protein